MAKLLLSLFLLAICLSFANSARLLDDVSLVDPQTTPAVTTPSTSLPSGQLPATTTGVAPTPVANDVTDPQLPDVPSPDDDVENPPTDTSPPVSLPATSSTTGVAPTPVDDSPDNDVEEPPAAASPPVPLPATPSTAGPTSTAATTATTSTSGNAPTLSFFMHDILGGTQPSVRVVTGIIARTDINGIPFSVPNNNFFPIQGGIPLPNVNNINNLINPNTAPLITGLNPGQANTVLQNSANNNNVVNGNNQPFVTAGQLPPGSIQKVMFGSITVIDDELTEGHELGSVVIGKAQGFYLASSLDGTSHTMAFSILLQGGDHHLDDSISFFGVHRTASPESQIAVVGGTGKYENAKGYATVGTLPQVDQHTTDGVDTVMQFNVYLSE